MTIGFFDGRERIPPGKMQTAFVGASTALESKLRSVQESSASSDENQPTDEQTAPLIITAQSILNRITAIEQKESRIPYLLCGSCCGNSNFHPPWEALTAILAHTAYILACLTNPADDEKDQKSLEKIPEDLDQLQDWR